MPEIIVKLGDRIIHRYFFDKDTLTIGRARDNDIVIENLSVSRNHSRIKREDSRFYLTDMNSANGTTVNGVKITKTEIFHNDQIGVGKHTLLFVHAEDAEASSISYLSVTKPQGEEFADGIIGILSVSKGKQAGQEFRIAKREVYVGRSPDNDVRLHDWFVSKKHAVIVRNGEDFILKDLDSWRGTTVNGSSIKEYALKEGDELVFGTTVLTFRRVSADEYSRSKEKAPAPPPLEPAAVGATEESASEPQAASAAPVPESAPPAAESAPPEPAPAAESVQLDVEGDDEFAPMTDDELEALEAESDLHFASADEDEERRAAWEMHEAEKMFDMGEDDGSLIEDEDELAAEEEAAVGEPHLKASKEQNEEAVAMESAEEEDALDGKNAPSGEILLEDSQTGSSSSPEKTKEITMWERALKNKSQIIRKNAAKELKKLTGKDYDWKSEPGS